MKGVGETMRDNKFIRSDWAMLRVAHLYHHENKPIREISKITNLSPSTITRLLQRARNTGAVRTSIEESLHRCINLSQAIAERYNLRFVITSPLSYYGIKKTERKKRYQDLALEGARYLQHIIRENDVLGVGCNWLIRDLADYLNPCWKKNIRFFIPVSGMLNLKNDLRNMETFIQKFTMSFGTNYSFPASNGFAKDETQLKTWLKRPEIQEHVTRYKDITISVANVQPLFKKEGPMPILEENMYPEELEELYNNYAIGEFLLRFFDAEGKEVESAVSKRTFAIDFETYARIPKKVLLAAGDDVVQALDVFLKNKMADILIADEYTASGLLSYEPAP